ncbi:uncharacterized protein CLUP02_08905 [Colletotrichum lupini]|uniref:Uncharacterized protein n=1 Tax=Colletotrichum lupini TaxID=145971 RepID=A0A9Q8SUQ1_9PEZI|nr:uncharacterized protein CLUP02_08905 [Colletotrichum lupini]UQC83410.1 hypothetical protein CLUP02_08905 [Colletotrichum lupini]
MTYTKRDTNPLRPSTPFFLPLPSEANNPKWPSHPSPPEERPSQAENTTRPQNDDDSHAYPYSPVLLLLPSLFNGMGSPFVPENHQPVTVEIFTYITRSHMTHQKQRSKRCKEPSYHAPTPCQAPTLDFPNISLSQISKSAYIPTNKASQPDPSKAAERHYTAQPAGQPAEHMSYVTKVQGLAKRKRRIPGKPKAYFHFSFSRLRTRL